MAAFGQPGWISTVKLAMENQERMFMNRFGADFIETV
jgi:hypothetical protein